MDKFMKKLLEEAAKAGITAAEIYLMQSESFRVMTEKGDLSDYSVNTASGLSLRGIVNGKMGYAYSQAFDDEAIETLVRSVIESASLVEDDSEQEIFAGSDRYPQIDNYCPALDQVSEQEKIAMALDIEKKAMEADRRIIAVPYNMLATERHSIRIMNSYGLDLKTRDNFAYTYLSALAQEGEHVANAGKIFVSRDFSAFDSAKIAGEAAADAVFMLNAEPVKSGTYRVIMDRYAMSNLLGVFSAIFSAENAQRGISLMQGKEGEEIASAQITIIDDPLLPDGLDSRPFDDEGVATQTKSVVENGVLKTLLHNLKTAKKAGVASTGNASKASYSSPVVVAPSNFFFKPGEKTLEQLMQDMGEGIVITDVSGLHAGASLSSGDFSLLAEGYTVKDGKKTDPVDRITVAGNFYRLLKNVVAVGNDLVFPGSNIGSPSVDVGELSIAGK